MSDRIDNNVLVKRCAMQQAQLALLSAIAEALTNQKKINIVLEELLLVCLKAAGIEKGVLYLFDINGKLLSQQVFGCKKVDTKKLETNLGRSPILKEVLSHKKSIELPLDNIPKNINKQFLAAGRLTAAILVPIFSQTQCLGALVLGSRAVINIKPDVLSFAKTLGAQIGQAIALENAFNSIVFSEKRYQQLMDDASCGFVVMNHQGIILETNKYIEKLLNCSKKYLIDKDFKEFIVPSMRSAAAVQFQKLLQNGNLDVNEIKVQPINEKVRTIYYSSSSVVIQHPKLANESLLLMTVTDVREFEKFKMETIEKKIENEIKLSNLIRTDSLTGINNRFGFLEYLPYVISDSKKNGFEFALLNIDINHFSSINNFLGRDAGDYVLKRLADFLKSSVKDLKNVARLSDKTFAIVLTKLSQFTNTEKFLKQLILRIKQPGLFRDKEIYISVGIGISVYPQDGTTVEQLLKHANLALQYSKKMGMDNYQFYHSNMNEPTIMQLQLESDLHRALEKKQLEVYYQPVITLDTQHIVGAEALLRWRHPTFGLLMPDQFIPLAESTGLIISIGEWVMNMACQQVKTWYDLGYVDLRVAVNLSARQFNDPDLQKMIMRILASSQILPAALILEITESILMQDINANSTVLQSLSDMGVTLASDDFGIGYSSLNYLRKLPFDALKIDKSFIHDMEIINQKEAIVATITALANNLDLKVIAEGVETRAQMDILKKYHCDFMQGYLFSKPITAEEFIRLLQSENGKKIDRLK